MMRTVATKFKHIYETEIGNMKIISVKCYCYRGKNKFFSFLLLRFIYMRFSSHSINYVTHKQPHIFEKSLYNFILTKTTKRRTQPIRIYRKFKCMLLFLLLLLFTLWCIEIHLKRTHTSYSLCDVLFVVLKMIELNRLSSSIRAFYSKYTRTYLWNLIHSIKSFSFFALFPDYIIKLFLWSIYSQTHTHCFKFITKLSNWQSFYSIPNVSANLI